jgi:hypothetical protein
MVIEKAVNLRGITIEDLYGPLLTEQEGYHLDDVDNDVGELLLLEEEQKSHQLQRTGASSSGVKKMGKPKGKPKLAVSMER